MTPAELHNAQVEALAKRLARDRDEDPRIYEHLASEGLWEVSEVVRKAGYVLVPESAISPVREGEED